MARKQLSIIDFYHGEAPFATEFRRLLHKIMNRKSEGELKSLLVTSAMLAEGKSTITSFLALTAAKHKGLKTLLIDSDLRRPTIHQFFGVDRQKGLADILSMGLGPKDTIKNTAIEKLDLITSGWVDTPAAEVFDAEAVARLVDQMKYFYDLVLVDTAPVLPVSDPMLLAPRMDGAILVVKAGSTQREIVQRAVDIIGRQKLMGVVMNDVDSSLPYYYDYGYYGYDYRPLPAKVRPKGKPKENRGTTAPGLAGHAVSDGAVRR
jgi:protein-tyrosine kinase